MKTMQPQIRIKKSSVAGMMMKPLVVLSAILVSSALCTAAWGQTNTIFSEDFESPDVENNNDPLAVPSGWYYVSRGRTDLNGINDDNPPSGNQSLRGFSNSGGYVLRTTATNLSDTVIQGATYTLSLLYWGTGDRQIHFEARLLAIDDSNNVTELGSDFRAEGDNAANSKANARDFRFTVTPTANGGERLVVELNSYNTGFTAHHWIDDLLLQSYVPPPAGTVLIIR